MNYQTDQDDNLSAEELRLLAPSSYGMRRTAIAKHPNTPADILELFYEEGANKYVRAALAGNANTPEWILDELYECADGFVASGLAKNPRTSAERVLKFSYWDNPYVRYQAVKNPLLPEYRVRELLRDGEEWVQWGAKKRLYGYVPIPELPGGGKPALRLSRGVEPVIIASRKVESPRSAAEREAELIRRIEAIGRSSAERERQAQLDAQEDLKRRNDEAIAQQVAEERKRDNDLHDRAIAMLYAEGATELLQAEKDIDMLRKLAHLASGWQKVALAKSENITPEIADHLATYSIYPPVWEALANNPITPPDALRRIGGSKKAHIQLALARNPLTPEVTLTKLIKKGGEVGTVASETLATIKEIQEALLAG